MKTIKTLLQLPLFSLLALSLVHCGSAGDGTSGSAYIEGGGTAGLAVPSIQADRLQGNDITLTFTMDSEADFSYIEIERKEGADGSFSYLGEVEALSYLDEDLTAGVTYYYRARAVYEQDAALLFSAYSEVDQERMPR